MDELKDKSHEFLQKWEDKSRDFINNFIELFGADGTLNTIWSQSTGRLKRALSPPHSPSRQSTSSTSDFDESFHEALEGDVDSSTNLASKPSSSSRRSSTRSSSAKRQSFNRHIDEYSDDEDGLSSGGGSGSGGGEDVHVMNNNNKPKSVQKKRSGSIKSK